FSGILTSQGYNLIGDTSGVPITGSTTGNQLGVDPLFDTKGLQDNGGPTKTIALRPNSPAIDKGDSGGSITDQRGFARPVVIPGTQPSPGDGSDIGAYEMQADQLPGCISPVVTNNQDGGAGSL